MKKVYETALHVTAFRATFSPPTRTHIMTITTTHCTITGNTLTIKGLIPGTPEEDFQEMRRMWNANSLSRHKPYTNKSQLQAIGGERQPK